MKRNRMGIRLLCLVVALAALAALPAQAGTLYGATDTNQTLYTISESTAALTPVAPVTGGSLSGIGMAYDSSTGKMYVSDVSLPCGPAIAISSYGLASIDPATGVITCIGSHVISSNIIALAYDSTNDVLYGFNFDALSLATINRATGAATNVGSPVGQSLSGLAYDPATDTLYGLGQDGNLYTVNRATGALTLVGPTTVGTSNYDGDMTVDPDTGKLLYIDGNGFLYALNKSTGATTVIGDTGNSDVNGLAVIPGGASATIPLFSHWALAAMFLAFTAVAAVRFRA